MAEYSDGPTSSSLCLCSAVVLTKPAQMTAELSIKENEPVR